MDELWPKPEADPGDQPHFLFLLTPPYSGSTAMAELLVTSRYITRLCANGEGHDLVPGMRQSGRWQASKFIDYESVLASWLACYQARKEEQPEAFYVIEKSPPNMMRIDRLLEIFPRHTLLVNNRNPYAACASYLYRALSGADLADSGCRSETLCQAVQHWLVRSSKLKELVQAWHLPVLTYEAFCEKPELLLRLFSLPHAVCDSVDLGSTLCVKDYVPNAVINHNARQIGLLSDSELTRLAQALLPYGDLLDFFGYAVNIS